MRNHTSALPLAMLVFAVAAFGARAAEHEHAGHGDAAKGHVAESAADKEIAAKQGTTYPLKACLVTAQKLGGDMGPAVDYIYKDRLVRFCCKGCIKKFEAKADDYLAQLDKAAKENPGSSGGKSQAAPADPHAGHSAGMGGCCN